MDIQTFETLCAEEFGKIEELSHPTDKLEISVEFDEFYRCNYRSNRFSSIEDEEDDNFDETTKISFCKCTGPNSDGSIDYVSVNQYFRGRGFGRKMVEAVERIFKKCGMKKSYVVDLDNPEFFRHLGYVQETNGQDFEKDI